MLTLETVNELTLRVTCKGGDILYTKAGAFIAGDNMGQKNYTFEKVLLGPQQGFAQAALGSLMRRAAGENLPLMKVTFRGDLEMGESISVESENLLAFTQDCKYGVRFLGQGIMSQKGMATTELIGQGPNSYVAITTNGNPIVLSNYHSGNTITVDPDAVVCWMGQRGTCDPNITTDFNWKTLIGQASGESYSFEWYGNQRVTVVIQPTERRGGIRVAVD